MKNLFKQNPALLPWLNGTAKFYNDMGNDVAEAYKGKEYHVGTLTYINTVQLVANPEFAKKLYDQVIDLGAEVVFEKDGSIAGKYRKMHIPDDPAYYEKFYFTPGNLGFKVFETRYAKLGVGICWDQWFPETARAMALDGAEILFYPTAIGSEPILECDSMPHWRRTMQGHAAANITPVIAANRIGIEEVTPCEENNNQSSSLNFYGSSFVTDEVGEIVHQAGRDEEAVIYNEYDIRAIRGMRMSWGLFRDRRPEMYSPIS